MSWKEQTFNLTLVIWVKGSYEADEFKEALLEGFDNFEYGDLEIKECVRDTEKSFRLKCVLATCADEGFTDVAIRQEILAYVRGTEMHHTTIEQCTESV
jgi:hypothetical protein